MTTNPLIKAIVNSDRIKTKHNFFSYTTLWKSILLLQVHNVFLYSSKIHNNAKAILVEPMKVDMPLNKETKGLYKTNLKSKILKNWLC